MRSSTLVRGSALAVIAALTAACADAPTAPDGFAGLSFAYSLGFNTGHAGGQVRVCKVGATAGFTVGGTPIADLNDGDCVTVASGFSNPRAFITVAEVTPANTTLDSIVKITGVFGPNGGPLVVNPPNTPDTTTITGTNSASAEYGLEWGTALVFYNTFTPPPPPPGGGEGCTPGYWKQKQHFDSYPTGYLPTDLFDTYFANAFPGKTLVQVAGQGGGGLNALGRHTVAALLNAASSGVSYDLSVAQVIAGFDAAYASGNYEAQKNIFEGFNEQGCPLN